MLSSFILNYRFISDELGQVMSFVQVIGLTEWRIVGAEKGIDEVMWPSEGGRWSEEVYIR